MQVEAVTFDYWNTICVPEDSRFRTYRLDALREALGELGLQVSHEDVLAATDGLVDLFNQHWRRNEQFTATEAVEHILRRLGADLPPHHAGAVTIAFAHAIEEPPPLAPNIGEVLADLCQRGVRLGIICDVGMTPSTVLRRYLSQHGLLGHFTHFSFSDEVGVYKPHARIFEHALEGLGGVDPTRVAHVGDLRRTDVAGARAAGMLSVRYRAVHDDDPASGGGDGSGEDTAAEADVVISDHAELLRELELA